MDVTVGCLPTIPQTIARRIQQAVLNKDGGVHEAAHGGEQRKRAGCRKDSRDGEENENSQKEEFTGGGGSGETLNSRDEDEMTEMG